MVYFGIILCMFLCLMFQCYWRLWICGLIVFIKVENVSAMIYLNNILTDLSPPFVLLNTVKVIFAVMTANKISADYVSSREIMAVNKNIMGIDIIMGSRRKWSLWWSWRKNARDKGHQKLLQQIVCSGYIFLQKKSFHITEWLKATALFYKLLC